MVVAMAENREIILLSKDLSLTLQTIMRSMISRTQVAMLNNNNLNSKEWVVKLKVNALAMSDFPTLLLLIIVIFA